VLVIAPHPDDESLGCGGTIAQYTQAGAIVELVVVSDGAALDEHGQARANLVDERQQETKAATAVLGISRAEALGFPDGQLAGHQQDIQEALRARIAVFQPELILCPSPVDSHPDHIVAARAILQLLRVLPGWSLAFYEVHAPVRPNVLIDVTEVLTIKERAIQCYHRSLFGQPSLFSAAMRGLTQHRSFFAQRQGFFEAFWLVSAPLTDQEILEWAMYGFVPENSETLTPGVLRGTDEILFALKEKTEEAEQSRLQVETLRQEKALLESKLQEQQGALTTLQQSLEQSRQELSAIQSSSVAWIRQFLRRKMDSVFPTGSRGRAVLRMLNRLRYQMTSKSLSE
jgi:LmbE family N-acetylglucosaminyl deacetylase